MKIRVTTSVPKYEDMAKQMDAVFAEMDKVFKQVDKTMEEVQTMSDEVLNRTQNWEPIVSWIPRKVGKRWYWHSPIYRKFVLSPGGGYWKYGTEFDVLKDSK